MRKVVLKTDEWFGVALAVAKVAREHSDCLFWQDLLRKLNEKLGGNDESLQIVLKISRDI
jgi:hypothetical protein